MHLDAVGRAHLVLVIQSSLPYLALGVASIKNRFIHVGSKLRPLQKFGSLPDTETEPKQEGNGPIDEVRVYGGQIWPQILNR